MLTHQCANASVLLLNAPCVPVPGRDSKRQRREEYPEQRTYGNAGYQGAAPAGGNMYGVQQGYRQAAAAQPAYVQQHTYVQQQPAYVVQQQGYVQGGYGVQQPVFPSFNPYAGPPPGQQARRW